MLRRPLLFFPDAQVADRTKLGRGVGEISYPSPERQRDRLSPKFEALCEIMDAQRVTVQQSAIGIIPEHVLVFETVGSVEYFSKAVSKVEGLEWLGEFETEEIIPDDDFYALNDKREREDKSLDGSLYLVFTNITAMNQLLSLWRLWIENPDFDCRGSENRGKGKFKKVFKLLKNIRKWDVQDRFKESNILRIWNESLQIDPDRIVRFEVELWYRSSMDHRIQSYSSVAQLISGAGGRVVTSCDIPEIHYHAILAELPASGIRNILSNRNTALLRCENIMYFRPSGQVAVDTSSVEEAQSLEIASASSLPAGNPIVAVLDGYPLSKHRILDNRLIIDDPDEMESHYQVRERKHGTAMCSLIVKGDLNNNETFLPVPLYIRPVMRPNENDRERIECIPDDILLIDTVHRAVRRIFEGDGNVKAVAPTVKIINLSICDRDRLFYHSMSPWSKLLDWLSYKYRVLFVVSAGNHYNSVELSIPVTQFESLQPIEKEKLFVREILNNSRNCRIMSPAESINSITVGALHDDNATFQPDDRRLNPYNSIFPSTYTAFGQGYRRAIKPDLACAGGRQMFDFHIVDNSKLTPSRYKRPPGLRVAAPDDTLNKTIHEIGTSNAAALTSRNGYFCYEVLQNLIKDNNINIENDKIAVLIKAMLVHGCTWDAIGNEIEKRLTDVQSIKSMKSIISRWIGYGCPNIDKVKECTEQRATVVGFGELREEEAHVYSLPLPPSLSSQTIKRRLTITLAWFSPVSSNTRRYRTSRLWFEAKNNVVKKRTDSDWQTVKRGTLQHEIFEGTNASAFIDGDTIGIKVNCSKDANSFSENIPYAILVSIEVAEGLNLPIYQEIKERISIPVPVGQRV
ncbi:MAG: S8 family peptidase [Prevotellaceae bacterium]|jgi:hypothetical protein|nr:S8 family peptidase [Prevotellaceae bacterium]